MHHWEFPIQEQIIQMFTCPIDLHTAIFSFVYTSMPKNALQHDCLSKFASSTHQIVLQSYNTRALSAVVCPFPR